MKKQYVFLALIFASLSVFGQETKSNITYTFENKVVTQKVFETTTTTETRSDSVETKTTTVTTKTLVSEKELRNPKDFRFTKEELSQLFVGNNVVREESNDHIVLYSLVPFKMSGRYTKVFSVNNGEIGLQKKVLNETILNLILFILWMIMPTIFLILLSFITPKKNTKRLIVFFVTILTTTLLGIVVGYYFSGGSAGGIAGCFTGYFTGTSDIWVVSQYLIFLTLACLLSFGFFKLKWHLKEKKLKTAVH